MKHDDKPEIWGRIDWIQTTGETACEFGEPIKKK